MPKVWNKRDARDAQIPANAIYIGRPSPFGNPFMIGRDGTREDVVRKYEEYLLARPQLLEQCQTHLKGRDLICWCAPEACHGDVLMRYANDMVLGERVQQNLREDVSHDDQ